MSANDRQVGGDHYKGTKVQHWDFVHMHNMDYFQAMIFRYILRWKDKDGLKDLHKAQHFLEKYIELQPGELTATEIQERMKEQQHSHCLGDAGGGYVDQD